MALFIQPNTEFVNTSSTLRLKMAYGPNLNVLNVGKCKTEKLVPRKIQHLYRVLARTTQHENTGKP